MPIPFSLLSRQTHLRRLSSLHSKYQFTPPPSLNPPPKNPKTPSPPPPPTKPQYRPPSTLPPPTQKPLLTKLPFDFRYSYTETSPNNRPIGLRSPKYSPFGPNRVAREWTGVCAPIKKPKVKSVDGGDEDEVYVGDVEDPKVVERRRLMREKILGKELNDGERKVVVNETQKGKTKRQVNLGRDGFTHNMLNDIHNHWKNAEAVRIKCMGVPTIDMKNVCNHLEDKTFGKIIHRHGGLLILYRGRHYKPKKRPFIPLMLWKPQEPVYPKLIKTTIEGLSIEETKDLRKRGLAVPALTKLSRNGYYGNLVAMVRDAFLMEELVRIDCAGLDKSDITKIGVKLRDLVPCIPVTFLKEQVVVWRGKNYQPREGVLFLAERESFNNSDADSVWSSWNAS